MEKLENATSNECFKSIKHFKRIFFFSKTVVFAKIINTTIVIFMNFLSKDEHIFPSLVKQLRPIQNLTKVMCNSP